MKKQLKEIVKALGDQGFVTSKTKGSHIKVTHPDHPGKTVFLPSTPSDYHGMLNSISYLRKMGFIWKGR